MKLISLIILLTTLSSCDPYGFGFKQNPAFVLNEAYEAVKAEDVKRYLSVTGKEALCLYGNTAGIAFLKKNALEIDNGIKLTPKVLNTTHYQSPKFVGSYWSYYHERYDILILDKVNQNELIEAIVDCEYGVEGSKNSKWINQRPAKYKKKECKIIKLIPKTFEALPISEKCESLRVDV